MNAHRMRRGAALSAAVALGFGGAVAAAPDASAVEAKATAKLAQQAEKDKNVQGFAQGTDGKPVVITVADAKNKGAKAKSGAATLDSDTQKAVKNAKAKVITLAKPAKAFAADPQKVIGGAGYFADSTPEPEGQGGLCSIGFSALSTDFAPQAVSAGHCTGEGDALVTGKAMNIFASAPSSDDAANTKKLNGTQWELLASGFAGSVSKYQFGENGQTESNPADEDNPTQGEGGEEFTDYSIIDLKDGAVPTNLVTKWNQAEAKNNDLAGSATKVTGVSKAKVGDSVTRSGRTTGSDNGKVNEYGSGVIATDGWLEVNGRKVYGFMSTVPSQQGDSGGSFIDDNGNAVGITSGGGNLTGATPEEVGPAFTWATDLTNALDQAGTGTRVNVAKKAKAEDQTVEPKADVKGTGANGFSGGTFVSSDGKKTDVTVDGDNWSFNGAENAGEHNGKLYLTSKYEVSEPLDLVYKVQAAPAPSESSASPTTDEPSETPSSSPSSSASPSATESESATPSPSQSTTDKPSTQAPAPKPAQAKITTSPQRISLSKFVGDGAKDKSVGVSIYATGAKPGSKVTITTSKDGIEAKKETATADKDGNVSTRVWGLPSASDTSVYLGTYKVTANMQPASGARASGTASKTLTSSFDVVKGDAGNGGGQDNGNDNTNDNGSDPSANDNGNLPRTGANVGLALATAAGLMALGAGIVLTVRRRGQQ